jgi:hypothetical protein
MTSIAFRFALIPIAFVIAFSATTRTQSAPPPPAVTLDREAMRIFLKDATIVKTRSAAKGVTNTLRATLSDGRVTHDAQIQTVDLARALFEAGGKTEVNFRDSYKFNIAGYELARLIGLDNVPMSVERTYQGKPAAFTWWLDDLLFIDGSLVDEEARVKKKIRPPDAVRFTQQVQSMRIFDELIQNADRNQGNALWDTTWSLWMVDHTRAFRLGRELKNPAALVTCERGLLEGLRHLNAEALASAVGKTLTRQDIAAVMARRDLLVQHYDALIARRGEDAVLFTLQRATAPVPE